MSMGLDDMLEVYAEMRGLKKEILKAKAGDEIRTSGVEVRIEGVEGDLALVFTVTKARK